MKVKVLAVSKNKGGYNVAHICCNGMYGDCLATDDVTEPGEYWLKSTLIVKEGRFTPLVRVERVPEGRRFDAGVLAVAALSLPG